MDKQKREELLKKIVREAMEEEAKERLMKETKERNWEISKDNSEEGVKELLEIAQKSQTKIMTKRIILGYLANCIRAETNEIKEDDKKGVERLLNTALETDEAISKTSEFIKDIDIAVFKKRLEEDIIKLNKMISCIKTEQDSIKQM